MKKQGIKKRKKVQKMYYLSQKFIDKLAARAAKEQVAPSVELERIMEMLEPDEWTGN